MTRSRSASEPTSPFRHTDRHFDAELRELKDRLLAMGGRCERLIAEALGAIEDGDVKRARAVDDADRLVNADELACDELAVRILALRSPVGRDLRLLVTALKVVASLETIGDEAVNVAERAGTLATDAEEVRGIKAILHEMGSRGAEMLDLALDAFVDGNAERAHRVLVMDDAVDAMHARALARSIAFMKRNPMMADVGMGLTSSAKCLERIADLATNIAEMVVYMVEGEDVRHGARRVH
ncbi:MAG: phosphate signaling complex protein PhoU [Sandaracinaceae bacterium]